MPARYSYSLLKYVNAMTLFYGTDSPLETLVRRGVFFGIEACSPEGSFGNWTRLCQCSIVPHDVNEL